MAGACLHLRSSRDPAGRLRVRQPEPQSGQAAVEGSRDGEQRDRQRQGAAHVGEDAPQERGRGQRWQESQERVPVRQSPPAGQRLHLDENTTW